MGMTSAANNSSSSTHKKGRKQRSNQFKQRSSRGTKSAANFELQFVSQSNPNLSIVGAFLNALPSNELKRLFTGSDSLSNPCNFVAFVDAPERIKLLHRNARERVQLKSQGEADRRTAAGEELPFHLTQEGLLEEERNQDALLQRILATSVVEDGSRLSMKDIIDYVNVHLKIPGKIQTFAVKDLGILPIMHQQAAIAKDVGLSYVVQGYRATSASFTKRMNAAVTEAMFTKVMCSSAQLTIEENPEKLAAWNEARDMLRRRRLPTSTEDASDSMAAALDEEEEPTEEIGKDGQPVGSTLTKREKKEQAAAANAQLEAISTWLVESKGGVRVSSPFSKIFFETYQSMAQDLLQAPEAKIPHYIAVVVGENRQLWILDPALSEMKPLTWENLINSLSFITKVWEVSMQAQPSLSTSSTSVTATTTTKEQIEGGEDEMSDDESEGNAGDGDGEEA